MAKPILYYQVRQQVNRSTGATILVPAIVEREQAVPLEEIIARAIDRGLIAGVKPSAAKQIAVAVASQMYEEFRQGRGVKFGNYFYARLYLDGTTDGDGTLSDAENGINVRFVSGTGFKLTLDQFSFSNVDDGDIPSVDFVISEADGAERNELIPSESVALNGYNLWQEGDMNTSVEFHEVDTTTGDVASDAAATVTSFATIGPNALTFTYPAGLVAGKTYMVYAKRSADGIRFFTSAGNAATVKEAE